MNHRTLYKKVKETVSILSDRYQRVVFLRFGIDGQGNTLDAIGKQYKITRERVRQILVKAFSDISSSPEKNILSPVFKWMREKISGHGGVVAEEWFLETYGKDKRGALLFALHLGEEFKRGPGDTRFHHRWFFDEDLHKKAMEELLNLERHLGKKNVLISSQEVESLLSNINFVNISKKVLKSALGGYGFSHWPEVLPKSIKDKAFVVLLKEGKPMHFIEITNRINTLKLGKKKALRQTVHNELIKDSRFVLVGRGLYALRDWGFRQGTVREVIHSLLKEKNRPLDRKELIDLVLKERFVQANTIILNLQGEGIVKLPDGRYIAR